MPSAIWLVSWSASGRFAGGSFSPIRIGNQRSTFLSWCRRDSRKAIISTLPLAAAIVATPSDAERVGGATTADMPSLITIYRDLHTHPELSGKEARSAASMAAEAKKAGFQVTTGVGGTGVVAVMKIGPGPVLLLRADM